MTLRELDGDELISLPSEFDTVDEAATTTCALSRWYAEIKDTDIEELDAYDLDQLLAQRLHRLFIIPVAIERFIKNPVQNGLQLSDLLLTLTEVSIDEWQNIPSSAAELRGHMAQIMRDLETTEDAEAVAWAGKLKTNLDIVSHLV